MDALRRLTGPAAEAPLAAAVAADGGRLVRWRVTQVDDRPGSASTATYACRVAWADRPQDETYVLRAPAGGSVTGWRYPHDPALPALVRASDPAAVRDLLVDLGLAPAGTAGADVRLTRRSYRPGRRAVVEVRTGAGSTFLKVVRPDRLADLHRRHALLAGAGIPVPPPLHHDPVGLLVLAALPGRSLRAALRAEGPRACDPRDLTALLDALPARLLGVPARPAWAAVTAHYAALLAAALPQEAGRARRVADAVEHAVLESSEPLVPVHGDFYEGQLLTRAGRLTGLLDVDGAGPGHRGDDVACLLAHLAVLPRVAPADATRLRAALAAWFPVLRRDPLLDPRTLPARTAGVLLSLATGPHRVLQPQWQRATSARLDLAEQWLRR